MKNLSVLAKSLKDQIEASVRTTGLPRSLKLAPKLLTDGTVVLELTRTRGANYSASTPFPFTLEEAKQLKEWLEEVA